MVSAAPIKQSQQSTLYFCLLFAINKNNYLDLELCLPLFVLRFFWNRLVI
jgi:hypothetical protein